MLGLQNAGALSITKAYRNLEFHQRDARKLGKSVQLAPQARLSPFLSVGQFRFPILMSRAKMCVHKALDVMHPAHNACVSYYRNLS